MSDAPDDDDGEPLVQQQQLEDEPSFPVQQQQFPEVSDALLDYIANQVWDRLLIRLSEVFMATGEACMSMVSPMHGVAWTDDDQEK